MGEERIKIQDLDGRRKNKDLGLRWKKKEERFRIKIEE